MGRRRRAAAVLRRVLACASVLVLVPAVALRMPVSGAAFMASSGNGPSTFAADTLGAPTGMTAVSACSHTMPTLVAAGAAAEGSSNGADMAVTRPAASIGDLVVLVIISGSGNIPAASGTTPAFSTAASISTSTMIGVHVLYRWVTAGTEPTTYTFAAVGGGRITGVARVYRNVDPTTPFGAPGTSYLASTLATTTTAPGLTTAGPKNLVLAVQGTRNGNSSPAYGTATGTTLSDISTITIGTYSSNSVRGRTGDIPMTNAGATGDSTISHANMQYRAGLQVPIRPAAGAGQITAAWSATSVQNWATGYELVRSSGGVPQATVTVPGAATTQYVDSTAGNGTFEYSLRATAGTWRSSAATASVTQSC